MKKKLSPPLAVLFINNALSVQMNSLFNPVAYYMFSGCRQSLIWWLSRNVDVILKAKKKKKKERKKEKRKEPNYYHTGASVY